MYLHSYQSLIWNQIVSRRVRQFGLKVLPGDLVKMGSEDNKDTVDDGTETDDDEEVDQGVTEFGEGRVQVRTLSEKEVEEASIFDILYPLPGDDIRLPANEVAEWYTELLQADGYSMSTFGSVHKKYGMYGSYRYMLERPGDLTCQIVHYADPDQDLLQTDLGVLRGQPPPTLNPEGPYKAVVLEFNLKVCCYATMAVRELTKCDTSISNQSLLSLQAREENEQRLQESDNKSYNTISEMINQSVLSLQAREENEQRLQESDNKSHNAVSEMNNQSVLSLQAREENEQRQQESDNKSHNAVSEMNNQSVLSLQAREENEQRQQELNNCSHETVSEMDPSAEQDELDRNPFENLKRENMMRRAERDNIINSIYEDLNI